MTISKNEDNFGKDLPPAESIKITHVRDPASLSHNADFLVVCCIDFRTHDEVTDFLHKRGLTHKYDLVALAGASLGIISETLLSWERTFLDHLKLVQDLHGVKGVMIIDHRNCGLFRKLLGAKVEATRETETEYHRKQFLKARDLIHSENPHIKVECLLMDLDGTIETILPLE